MSLSKSQLIAAQKDRINSQKEVIKQLKKRIKKSKKPLTKNQINAIITLEESRYSHKNIAKIMGISRSTVTRVIQQAWGV